MNVNISYRHLKGTPSLDMQIQKKVEHLKKYFEGNVDVNWVCSIEHNVHRSEVNVHAGHFYFHAEDENENLYKTFDGVLVKIEKQLRRKNRKLKDKIHSTTKPFIV